MEDSCPTCVQASLRGLQTDQCFDSIHLIMRQTLKENDKPSPFVNAFPKLSADSWGRFGPPVYLSVLTLCFLDFSVMHLSAPLCNCPSVHYPSPRWTGPRFPWSFQSTITTALLSCDRLDEPRPTGGNRETELGEASQRTFAGSES